MPNPSIPRSLLLFALLTPALGGCDDALPVDGREVGEPDGPAGSDLADWDVVPSHEEGDQVQLVNTCALLEAPRVTWWTLVDAQDHTWVIDHDRSEPTALLPWVPLACFDLGAARGTMIWHDDGAIFFDCIHEAAPSSREDTWLGTVRLDHLGISDACRDIFVDHDAWLPTFSLVRPDPG